MRNLMLEFKIEKTAIETNPHFPDLGSFRIQAQLFIYKKNLGKKEVFYFLIFSLYFGLPV
jgi:hypothetical protein